MRDMTPSEVAEQLVAQAAYVANGHTGTPADFSEACLCGQDFIGQDLSGADFSSSSLANVNAPGANFTGCSFAGAQLSCMTAAGANFTGCSFAGAQLSSCNLTGAVFSGADLASCTWVCHEMLSSGAVLDGAIIAVGGLRATIVYEA